MVRGGWGGWWRGAALNAPIPPWRSDSTVSVSHCPHSAAVRSRARRSALARHSRLFMSATASATTAATLATYSASGGAGLCPTLHTTTSACTVNASCHTTSIGLTARSRASAAMTCGRSGGGSSADGSSGSTAWLTRASLAYAKGSARSVASAAAADSAAAAASSVARSRISASTAAAEGSRTMAPSSARSGRTRARRGRTSRSHGSSGAKGSYTSTASQKSTTLVTAANANASMSSYAKPGSDAAALSSRRASRLRSLSREAGGGG